MVIAELDQVYLKARKDVKFYVRQASSRRAAKSVRTGQAGQPAARTRGLDSGSSLRAKLQARTGPEVDGDLEAMSLEFFLQMGIDAFHWIAKADEFIRGAVYRGVIEYDAEVDDAIARLYRRWLRPCPIAEQWIAEAAASGYKIHNLEEFRKCCEEVRGIERFLNHESTSPLSQLRDGAIEAYQRGECCDFDFMEPAGLEGAE